MKHRLFRTLAVCSLTILSLSTPVVRTGEIGFSKTTIDFGVVVSDIEKSLAFYTDVVGFSRAGNFAVKPQVANDAGLTEITEPLKIEKLKLGDDKTATTLKLMQVGGANPQKPANETIHATLGMSYMTIFVTDTRGCLMMSRTWPVESTLLFAIE